MGYKPVPINDVRHSANHPLVTINGRFKASYHDGHFRVKVGAPLGQRNIKFCYAPL